MQHLKDDISEVSGNEDDKENKDDQRSTRSSRSSRAEHWNGQCKSVYHGHEEWGLVQMEANPPKTKTMKDKEDWILLDS